MTTQGANPAHASRRGLYVACAIGAWFIVVLGLGVWLRAKLPGTPMPPPTPTAEEKANAAEVEARWSASPAGKINARHPEWGAGDCYRLANHELWIGMTAPQASYSQGQPEQVNRTITAGGTREQWCYGKFCKPALYFDNGILTSYQE